ncbi:hypothetical protein LC612_27800 [Nostoc sp. CHAB 5834]|nr:hypothetical protein [Nostoc sp. CHAB 5834]
MMKFKFLVLPAIVAAVCFIGQTISVSAQAAPVCKLSTLNSSYGAQSTGTVVSPIAPFTASIFGFLGLVVFDRIAPDIHDKTVDIKTTPIVSPTSTARSV